jgi:hypothetical protein
MKEMASKSDAFFQKAITSLARALAHINPTPEDKVTSYLTLNLIFNEIA